MYNITYMYKELKVQTYIELFFNNNLYPNYILILVYSGTTAREEETEMAG